jgi:hypothetical protein
MVTDDTNFRQDRAYWYPSVRILLIRLLVSASRRRLFASAVSNAIPKITFALLGIWCRRRTSSVVSNSIPKITFALLGIWCRHRTASVVSNAIPKITCALLGILCRRRTASVASYGIPRLIFLVFWSQRQNPKQHPSPRFIQNVVFNTTCRINHLTRTSTPRYSFQGCGFCSCNLIAETNHVDLVLCSAVFSFQGKKPSSPSLEVGTVFDVIFFFPVIF